MTVSCKKNWGLYSLILKLKPEKIYVDCKLLSFPHLDRRPSEHVPQDNSSEEEDSLKRMCSLESLSRVAEILPVKYVREMNIST